MKSLLFIAVVLSAGCAVPKHCKYGDDCLVGAICHGEQDVAAAMEKCPQGITGTGECKHDAFDFESK